MRRDSTLPLAFLAPDIVEAIITGMQPVDLTIKRLRRMTAMPYASDERRSRLGFPVKATIRSIVSPNVWSPKTGHRDETAIRRYLRPQRRLSTRPDLSNLTERPEGRGSAETGYRQRPHSRLSGGERSLERTRLWSKLLITAKIQGNNANLLGMSVSTP